MDARIEKLLGEFEKNGWKLLGDAEISNDWWFKEIIHLISLWRPVNKNLYLTLLTEPQIINKKVVWCLGISSAIPANKDFNFIETIPLNNIKKINLTFLVKKINSIVLN